MNHYSVLCILNKSNELKSVEVFAENVSKAKSRALAKLRSQGYQNARLAPDYPEAPVVIELSDKEKYEVTLLLSDKKTEFSVNSLGRDIDEAIANAITIGEFTEICGCVVSRDSSGKPKVIKGWH